MDFCEGLRSKRNCNIEILFPEQTDILLQVIASVKDYLLPFIEYIIPA